MTESTPALVERLSSERPDVLIAEREDHNQVRCAVQQLDDKQRTPLEMAYFGGLTHAEIAQQLGEPLGTIKTRIRTALQTLRSTLRSVGGGHDDL
jgi:RNA polymerase sigma-70 factor (ECF subfamily)